MERKWGCFSTLQTSILNHDEIGNLAKVPVVFEYLTKDAPLLKSRIYFIFVTFEFCELVFAHNKAFYNHRLSSIKLGHFIIIPRVQTKDI